MHEAEALRFEALWNVFLYSLLSIRVFLLFDLVSGNNESVSFTHGGPRSP